MMNADGIGSPKKRGRPRKSFTGTEEVVGVAVEEEDIVFVEPSVKDQLIDKMEGVLVEWINDQRGQKIKIPALALKSKAKRVFRSLKANLPPENTVFDSFLPDQKWLLAFMKRWSVRYDASKKTFVSAKEVLKRTKQGTMRDSALEIREDVFKDEFEPGADFDVEDGITVSTVKRKGNSRENMDLDEELVDISRINTSFLAKRVKNMLDVKEPIATPEIAPVEIKSSLISHDGFKIPVESVSDVVVPVIVPDFEENSLPGKQEARDPDFVPSRGVEMSPTGKRFTEKKLRIMRRKADEFMNCVIKYDPDLERQRHVIELISKALSYYEGKNERKVRLKLRNLQLEQQPQLNGFKPPAPPAEPPPIAPLLPRGKKRKLEPINHEIPPLQTTSNRTKTVKKIKPAKPTKMKKVPAKAVPLTKNPPITLKISKKSLQVAKPKSKKKKKIKKLKNGLNKVAPLVNIKSEPIEIPLPDENSGLISVEDPGLIAVQTLASSSAPREEEKPSSAVKINSGQPGFILSEVKVELPDPEDPEWHLRLAKEIFSQFDDPGGQPTQ